MFTLIMPAVKWQMHENYAKYEAYNYNALKEKENEVGVRGQRRRSRTFKSVTITCHLGCYWCITCLHKMSGLNLAYNELFSYERGNFFMLCGLAFEILEVINQTSQLFLPSHERPLEWIMSLSLILILNGLLLPVPFVVSSYTACSNKLAKFLLVGIDTIFDVGCLLINIWHPSKTIRQG